MPGHGQADGHWVATSASFKTPARLPLEEPRPGVVALGLWAGVVAVRGVLVHAAIAVDATGGLLGLVDEEVWTRKGGVPVVNRRRPFVEKESHRWLRSCEQAAERLKGARSITMVSDAESDIYELFAGLPKACRFWCGWRATAGLKTAICSVKAWKTSHLRARYCGPFQPLPEVSRL